MNAQSLISQLRSQPRFDAPCSDQVNPTTETLYPLRANDGTLVLERCLHRRSLLKLVGDHRGEEISCLEGAAWITQPGDPQDFVLEAGDAFTVAQKGAVVVQGMTQTRLLITRFSPILGMNIYD